MNPIEEIPGFREIENRFSRLANAVTTKSDVFKIKVTIQTGYIDDTNNVGILKYRGDAEFTTTSENQAKTTYR